MPVLLQASVEYGSYISLVKYILFLIFFFGWAVLVTWVHRDARSVKANDVLWTSVLLAVGAISVLVWLLVPIFIMGLSLFILATGATSISYVMHRNTLVPEFERVLTAEHIRGLLSDEQKKLDALRAFSFITANNNEVPMPEPKTADFFGYKIAYEFFSDAIRRRASDIVFAPDQEGYSVAYYIDGAPARQPSIRKDQMEYFTHFVKSLADLDVNERRKPQKGKFRVFHNKQSIEWQLSCAGSTVGEQVQIKRAAQSALMRLNELGFNPDQYEQLSRLHEVRQGLFIIAGTKGSGVTTTFYALLRNHDPFLFSINSLERKPLCPLPNLTQNIFSLSDSAVTTYGKKLLEIIRMGSDIVGVADCSDPETVQVACNAAKDGKLIYATIEAENISQAIGLWVKLAGDRSLALDRLLGITNQRLLRKLCPACRQAYEPNKELLRKFNLPADKAAVLYREGKVIYDKHGKPSTCEQCQGTGFIGRLAVFETVILDDQLRIALKTAKSLADITAGLRKAKVLYLQEQAMRKVIDGTTSVNEVVRVFASQKKQTVEKPEQTT